MSIIEGIFFDRLHQDTDARLSLTQLGDLPGIGTNALAIPEYRKTQVGNMIRWEVDAIVIPVTPNNNDIRLMRSAINEYVADFLNTNDWHPIDIRDLPNGQAYIRTRGQQRGNLFTLNASALETEIDTGVVLAEVDIIEDDMMPHGAMVVRFIFIKESTIATPTQKWCSFRIRVGGTGSETARTNLTDSGVQSSKLTQISRQTDGIIDRVTVRTYYASESGTRNQSTIQSYVFDQKEDMLWNPPQLRITPRGEGIYLNTKNNFGDLTLDATHGGSASETLLTNCTLADARIVNDDGAGGVEIEYEFVKVRPAFQPASQYIRFRIRSGGDGGTIATVPFTINDVEAAWLWDLIYQGEGLLTTATVRVWMPNDHGTTTLLNVQAKGEGIRNSCLFKPPLIKELPRGKGIMPNIHNNFGDLMIHTSYVDAGVDGSVLLANCTMLEPPRISNSLNDGGAMITLKFGRIANSNAIE